MYNSLILVALLPLSGPDAGQHIVDLPAAAIIRYSDDLNSVETLSAQSTVDPAEQIPVVRTTLAKPEIASDWAAPVVPPSGSTPRLAQPTRTSDPRQSDPRSIDPAPLRTFAPMEVSQPMVDQNVPTLRHNPALNPGTTSPINPPPTPVVRAADPTIVQAQGILKIPKWNNVILSANHQAILRKLRTEQRDAQGNILLDPSGEPIIVPLREGMFVYENQVLGKFDDQELCIGLAIQQEKLNVAKAAQEKQIEVEHAAHQVRTSMAALNMYKEANRRHEGAITPMEMIKAELEVLQAKANLELQKYTIDVERAAEVVAQQKEVEGMKIRIEERKLTAPISGMIVKIDKAEGEWLREGDPVLEIIQLDTLRAICKVDARHYTQNMVEGKEATVLMPMVNDRTEEFPGKVVFADQRVTAGEEFEVFIEVQNRRVGRFWLLQPGRTVTARIKL